MAAPYWTIQMLVIIDFLAADYGGDDYDDKDDGDYSYEDESEDDDDDESDEEDDDVNDVDKTTSQCQ